MVFYRFLLKECFEETMLRPESVIPTFWWVHVNITFDLIDKTSEPQVHSHINDQEGSIVFIQKDRTTN